MRDKIYEVPEYRKVRVLIDSDAACECDDHFAIAHALMSPKIEVVGIIAEHFGNRGEFNTMMASYGEIEELLKWMDATDTPLWHGTDKPLGESGEGAEIEAVEKIIAECNKDDDRPLFYIGQGAMTTLAVALKAESKIASKMVCIATGGANYPEGGFEFNFMNDTVAADCVMKSELPVWMVPEEVYSTMQVSNMELYQRLHDKGNLGTYLFQKVIDTQNRMIHMIGGMQERSHESAISFPSGECWSLGDSCWIGILTAFNAGKFTEVEAPEVKTDGTYHLSGNGKKIRLYQTIDSRLIIEDFFAKLEYETKE